MIQIGRSLRTPSMFIFNSEMKDSLLLMDAFRELAKMRMTAKLGRDGK